MKMNKVDNSNEVLNLKFHLKILDFVKLRPNSRFVDKNVSLSFVEFLR